jgi:hypothetical protein
MKRQPQVLLIVATLACSWLAMQAVHELGHIAAAAVSGGRVKAVILHPATLSYTQLAANPHPLFVSWMGPIVGVVLPLAALAIARMCRLRNLYLFQFFAGFCLIANGAYLAFGSLNGIGDADDIMRHGSPLWLLWLFGVITIPLGLLMWNRLGPYFGLGAKAGQVERADAYIMCALLAIIVLIEILLSPTAVRV